MPGDDSGSWLSHDQLVFIVGSMVIHELVFWSYGLFFHLARKNKWFEAYRLGDAPPAPLVSNMIREVCISHFVTQPVTLWALYFVAKAIGMKFELQFDSLGMCQRQCCQKLVSVLNVCVNASLLKDLQTPSICSDKRLTSEQTLKGIVVAMLWEDFFLYWGHRLLHQPPFYKLFHKKHHEFKTNIPAVSEYATIGEVMLDNVLPTVIGGFVSAHLFQWHVISFWIWLGLRVSESCDSHCGYQLPWSPWCLFPVIQGGAARHEFHHSHNIGNYGSFFVFWDWLCGTDVAWKKFRNEQLKKQKQTKT